MDQEEQVVDHTEVNGGIGDSSSDHQLVLTVALQQKEIDRLNDQMKQVLSRLDVLESNAQAPVNSARSGYKSAPPTTSRRRTIDPRQMRQSQQRADDMDGKKRPSMSATKRTAGKERLAAIRDEPGTYKMYLQGRPVTFRLPEGFEMPKSPEPAQPPDSVLKMDWVYGYRGRDCRNNVWLLGSGEMIYFTAAVCVIQTIEGVMSQRHYTEHTDDIKCLTVHPDKVTVATGQVAGHEKPAKGKSSKAAATNPRYMPHVRIWNSSTLETLKVIGAGSLDRAVACVSFSQSDGGSLLSVVDEHNDHRLSVWEWNRGTKGTKLAEIKASQDAVYLADFHPQEANQIVCCGKNQLSFWTLEGKNLSKRMALFERHDKPKFITCLTFTPDGHVVTGDSNGSILFWLKGSNKISSAITNAHDGVIFSLYMTADGSLVSGGGKDRLVKTWALDTKESVSSAELPEEHGCPRVVLKTPSDQFIVGTTKNAIICGPDLSSASPLARGHHGELWGLAEAREGDVFITCAHDSHVTMWDAERHQPSWTMELPESCQCLAVNPAGDRLVVGCRTPNWYIYSLADDRQQVVAGSCGSEQIECVEFSPDGSHLAFGSRDNHIYIYKLDSNSAEQVAKCQGHSSFITHIDWSQCGNYIRSNSGDYELLYWDASKGKQFTEGDQIRDLQFVTQNCVLSLNTVGMWQKGADGTDINGCCMNHSSSLLASADDFGKVNLFTYPSRTPEAKCHSYPGHSSHVTSVRFTSTDKYLLSAGGKDSTVIQWTLS